MQSQLKKIIILAGLAAFPVFGQESPPVSAPDKEKLSYALGMNLALELKDVAVDVDANIAAQAIKDVLQGKQTELQEGDVPPILQRAEEIGRFKLSSKYIAEGEAFLATNAAAPGVTVLPDGLQYRVLKTGTGNLPKHIEILTLKYRGTWIDGKEFNHNDRLEIPFWGCPRGLQEALARMKVGSHWQIFVPYNIAYGHLGERTSRFGSALIYDLELVNAESETAHPNQHHSSGRLGHSLDEDLLPAKFRTSAETSR